MIEFTRTLVNGAAIVAYYENPDRKTGIVLAKNLPHDISVVRPQWITWCTADFETESTEGPKQMSAYWGHYFQHDEAAARRDFHARVGREQGYLTHAAAVIDNPEETPEWDQWQRANAEADLKYTNEGTNQ
jgi:hypothetical protein